MNTKITFVHANHFDLGAPDCGFDPQKEHIIVGDGYEFSDWLSDRGVRFNQDSDDADTYFILGDDLSSETRTGEVLRIIGRVPTDEPLQV